MLFKVALGAFAALAPFVCSAQPWYRRDEKVTDFNPPTLMPVLHLNIIVDLPINSTSYWGITSRSANKGGMSQLLGFAMKNYKTEV